MKPGQDSDAGVIYEVDLEAEKAIEGPFDTWLRDHIADVLQFDGFLSAEILVVPAESENTIRRVVQYRLRNKAALDDYLEHHADRLRAQGRDLFGGRYSAQRRVLAHREEFLRGAVSTENCLNCGEVLTGQHCSHCGQRARVRVLSLWGLLKELFGDLTEWDSRVWRTLRPLAFKPGFLTMDYLRGRRARYTPPFRMYLILSLGFFLLASITSDLPENVSLDVDEAGEANLRFDLRTPESMREDTDDEADTGAGQTDTATPAENEVDRLPPAAELDPATQRLIDEIAKRAPEGERERIAGELKAELMRLTPGQSEAAAALLDPCNEENFKLEMGPKFKPFEARLREACQKIVADGEGFGQALFENIPKMMFVFLPLMALVMYLLYIGSGRYYVEHLLFFVHFHSFFFLAGIAVEALEEATLASSGVLSSVFEFSENALVVVLTIYVPYYLYGAMRRVYQQGRGWTLAKFGALVIAYIGSLALTGVGLLVYTALTI